MPTTSSSAVSVSWLCDSRRCQGSRTKPWPITSGHSGLDLGLVRVVVLRDLERHRLGHLVALAAALDQHHDRDLRVDVGREEDEPGVGGLVAAAAELGGAGLAAAVRLELGEAEP